MKRRFNYTGRNKLTMDKIKISLNDSDKGKKSINAKIDLSDSKYPEDARVFLDAYHKTERKRFDFGTVSEIKVPYDLTIDELAFTDNLMFRIVIVDESSKNGLIVAHADRIRTDDNLDKKPILPVSFENLNYQAWKIEFKGDSNGPILCINNQIPNIEYIVKNDPMFFIYIFHTVVKEIFLHMIFVDVVEDLEDPSTDWHADWIDFAKKLLPNEALPKSLNHHDENEFDKETVLNWIDKIIEEFCNSKLNEWQEFKSKLENK